MSQFPDEQEALQFRKILPKEAEKLYQLELQLYPEAWSLELIRQSLEAPLSYSEGVFDREELLGYCLAQIYSEEAHLLNLAVASEWQTRGLGAQLLDRLIDRLKERACTSLLLEVRPSNQRARQLYESRAFEFLMSRDHYYSDGEAALVLIKRL